MIEGRPVEDLAQDYEDDPVGCIDGSGPSREWMRDADAEAAWDEGADEGRW